MLATASGEEARPEFQTKLKKKKNRGFGDFSPGYVDASRRTLHERDQNASRNSHRESEVLFVGKVDSDRTIKTKHCLLFHFSSLPVSDSKRHNIHTYRGPGFVFNRNHKPH